MGLFRKFNNIGFTANKVLATDFVKKERKRKMKHGEDGEVENGRKIK